MHIHDDSSRPECENCSGCSVGDSPPTPDAADEPGLAGWRLVSTSIGMFLVPIALAIIGAICGGGNPGSQLLGALVGLTIGIVAAVGIARLLHGDD